MAQIILLSILSSICLLMIFLVLSELNNKFAKLSLIILYLFAPIFLWYPDLSSEISQAFGIGRGLDLIVLLFIFVTGNSLYFVFSSLFKQQKMITELTRHLALREAVLPNSKEISLL